MNIKQFSYMCRLSQKNLKKFVFSELQKTHKKIVSCDGFVYAKGTFPVMLVAHLDTVHAHLPQTIDYDKNLNTLSAKNGLGADDRCGVYMILEIVKKYNCSVVFCEDEETGGAGAEKFSRYFLDNCADELNNICYLIEIDRQGKNDAVFYSCANDDFEKFVTKGYFDTNYGTFSDISIICPDLCVAGVNLSCGYYKQHTVNEYVNIGEFNDCLAGVLDLLESTDKNTKFEYVEEVRYNKYYRSAYGWSDYEWDECDEHYYTIAFVEDGRTKYECVVATSLDEAIGKFVAIHDTVCYREIVDAYRET